MIPWSFSYAGSVWYSDSFQTLGDLKLTAYPSNVQIHLHIRDYRPYITPALDYGETYRLALFRGYMRYSRGGFYASLGDDAITFGRGLSIFLADDEKALLEATLRGVRVRYSPFELFAGLKRRWIYYVSDGDTTLLGGFAVEPAFGSTNLGLTYLRYALYNGEDKDGNLFGFYSGFRISPFNLYFEGAYREGYDVYTFSRNSGYALYSNLEVLVGSFVAGVELKDYDRISQRFNLPSPANGYGLLPSDGRDEVGGSFYASYGTFNLELSRAYSHGDGTYLGKGIMEYYSLSYYRNFGNLTPKLGAHHMDWGKNLNERLGFLEVKYNSSPGLILKLEDRLRLIKTPEEEWEHQPYASLSLIYGNFTLSLSYRRYTLSGKSDRVAEFIYDSFSFLRLYVSYGRFSGDIVCSSGVCRYEPPFEGLKASVSVYYEF